MLPMKVMEKQLQGLTQMEVKRRIDAGKTNHFKAKTGSKELGDF